MDFQKQPLPHPLRTSPVRGLVLLLPGLEFRTSDALQAHRPQERVLVALWAARPHLPCSLSNKERSVGT